MIVFFLLGRKAQSFELFLWVETQTLKCQCRIRGEFVFQESWGLHSMRNHLRKVTGQRWRSAGKRSTAKDCGAIKSENVSADIFKKLAGPWKAGEEEDGEEGEVGRVEGLNFSQAICQHLVVGEDHQDDWVWPPVEWVPGQEGLHRLPTMHSSGGNTKDLKVCIFVFSHVHFFAETVWLWRRVWGPKPNRPGAQVSPEGEENVPRFQVEATQAMLDKQLLANKKTQAIPYSWSPIKKKLTPLCGKPTHLLFPCRRDRG